MKLVKKTTHGCLLFLMSFFQKIDWMLLIMKDLAFRP